MINLVQSFVLSSWGSCQLFMVMPAVLIVAAVPGHASCPFMQLLLIMPAVRNDASCPWSSQVFMVMPAVIIMPAVPVMPAVTESRRPQLSHEFMAYMASLVIVTFPFSFGAVASALRSAHFPFVSGPGVSASCQNPR